MSSDQKDYMKDGLLHCGKCHTPKQVRMNFNGTEKIVSCLCECQTKERNWKNRLNEKRQARQMVDRMYERGATQGKIQDVLRFQGFTGDEVIQIMGGRDLAEFGREELE